MTRDEYIEKYHHVFSGILLDGLTTRLGGAELSIKFKGLIDKVDTILAQQYDAISHKQPLNGAVQPQQVKR